MTGQKERRIYVNILELAVTHLLVATSEDLPGLYVAARSVEQIERELPDAIRELLEAEGITVRNVVYERRSSQPSAFELRDLVAKAYTDDLAHA